MSDPAAILVVRLSAMGDVIHALPAVSTLKRSFPGARVVWAVEPRWAVLLRDNPFVDEVVPIASRPWSAGWRAAIRRLRANGFDLAIDFQGLLKSALIAAAAGPRRRLGFGRLQLREPVAAWLYSERARSEGRHVVDQNLDLAEAAGARTRTMEFPLPQCAPEGELPDGDFALSSPFAGWCAKQWPEPYYVRLARLLMERCGLPLVINCAPGERRAAEAIVRLAAGCALLNVTSVEGLVGVTRRARVVVGVDSGPLHLAAALARPGVALFGPTDPARNGPYGDSFVTIRSPEAVITYKRTAAIDASMWAIQPEQVSAALSSLLELNR